MHIALPYDTSPISLSNFDKEVFSPKHNHQYCFLPRWWLPSTNQSVFTPGCTRTQTTFSFQTAFFRRVRHVSLPRRCCAPLSQFVTNGEVMVRAAHPKHNRRVTAAGEGWVQGHRCWSTDRRKGAGRCPGYLASIALLTSDYFIRFPLSAFTPKLIYWVLQNPFSRPALC